MNEPIISAEHVSKRYVQNEYRVSLRHEAITLLQDWLTRRHTPKHESEPFWALSDVSFRVFRGDSVGIVGHNGAGKSTLFRILCHITEPTSGSVTVRGRFAPLIALGAGFNLELTGRQNIYLSAAIHGFNRKQVDAVLADILEFAELGDFIDRPVKRYSSGMTARLGFSIAVNTAPDIIFLDEILSVGDLAFQQKCKRRIAQFKEQGRTLLFVSHSSGDVRTLCDRAIWLDHGKIIMDNESNIVVDAYEAAVGVPNSRKLTPQTQEID